MGVRASSWKPGKPCLAQLTPKAIRRRCGTSVRDTCITTWPATCATTATISAHTSKKIGTPSALRSAARSTSWSARWTVTISISPVISCRIFSTARPHRTTTARSRTDGRSSRTGGSRGPTRPSCAWRSTSFRRTRRRTSLGRDATRARGIDVGHWESSPNPASTSALDIAERRRPQDGRIRVRLSDRELDVRVSTVPTLHGDSVVLRVLDRGGRPVGLDTLGMPAAILEQIKVLAKKPHGMVLVTGPTGSGKTTTLYAALGLPEAAAEKIITIEDPIEYQLPGITQVPVHAQTGLTFA